MSKTAILSVRIVADAKKALAGFNQAAGGLDKLEGGLKKAAGASTVAAGAVVAMGKQALDAASALQQSTGAVESVFKAQAGAIKDLAADAANSVGLSANQYQEFASVMGSQLKNLGTAQGDLVPTTDKLITMGADLASMYGGTTADAVEALSAVFRGETDPIEKYGISIKQSDINSRLAAKGLGGLEGEARRQAETQERLAMLTEQSADAQGNFARETDTAAGSAQIAAAHWENAKAALGEALLPAATQVAEALADLAQRLGEHPALVARVAGAVIGVTGALWSAWAAVKVWKGISAITSTVTTVWGAMTGKIVAGNVTAATSSTVTSSASAAAWVGAGIRAAGAWVAMKVRAVGTFIATAASATAHATATAASWVAAGVRAAGAWLAMQVRSGIAFAATAASAVANAAATAAAWVASAARAAGAFIMQNAAMLAVRGATLAMAAAQAVLNAVMSANPIGIVVVAVAALVAALVLAYNKSETFRNAVQAAGRIAAAAFRAVWDAVSQVISAIGSAVSRVGGVGGAFRSAMNIARGAVNWLMSPLRGLIGIIERVIGAIGRIRFPSPPAWFDRVFSGGSPSMTGVPAAPMRFMAPSPLTFAAWPDLTAARSASLASLTDGPLGRSSGSVTIDQSVTITVDGSGIWDPRTVAEQIREVLSTDRRNRGLTVAAGGGAL